VRRVSFDQDGNTLASTGGRTIKLWSRVGHYKRDVVWRNETSRLHGKWSVSCVSFTADGTTLAAVFVAHPQS
jgi:WD40 repeat protein